MFHSKVSVFLAVFLSGELTSAALPSYLKVCKREQNTINECVLNRLEELHPYLLKGIPELNVPSIDPLTIGEIKAVNGQLEALHVVLKNVQVYGFSKYHINSVDVDLEAMEIKVKLSIPELDVTGQFSVDAHVLAVPLKGEGPLTANITHCDVSAMLKFTLEKQSGQDYVKFTYCDIKLRLKDYDFTLSGLFKEVGDVAQKVVYENKRELLRILTPFIEKTISHAVVLDNANRIASSATYDELLPLP